MRRYYHTKSLKEGPPKCHKTRKFSKQNCEWQGNAIILILLDIDLDIDISFYLFMH